MAIKNDDDDDYNDDDDDDDDDDADDGDDDDNDDDDNVWNKTFMQCNIYVCMQCIVYTCIFDSLFEYLNTKMEWFPSLIFSTYVYRNCLQCNPNNKIVDNKCQGNRKLHLCNEISHQDMPWRNKQQNG